MTQSLKKVGKKCSSKHYSTLENEPVAAQCDEDDQLCISLALTKEPHLFVETCEESKTEGTLCDDTSEYISDAESTTDLFDEDGETRAGDTLCINTPSEENIYKKFEQWLKGPDGGRKHDHSSTQCSRQVQLVVRAVDPENPKVSNLFHKSILRDKWLTKFEKREKTGIEKSYLGALNQFYVFLKSEKPPCAEVSTERLSCLSDKKKKTVE